MNPHHSFSSLDPGKQESIRNSCLEEFVRGGYSGASTNSMCKNAGISKGLLFYYFKNKKNLFVYLTDYSTKLLIEKFYEGMEYNKEDLFERLLKWTMRKWALSEQYPLHYAFLVKQLLDCPPDINLKVTEMRNEYKAQSLSLFMHNLDFSNLRQGISKQKALEVVFYVIEGLKERNIAKYKQNPRPLNELHNEILNDIKEYLDICRHGICNGRD